MQCNPETFPLLCYATVMQARTSSIERRLFYGQTKYISETSGLVCSAPIIQQEQNREPISNEFALSLLSV